VHRRPGEMPQDTEVLPAPEELGGASNGCTVDRDSDEGGAPPPPFDGEPTRERRRVLQVLRSSGVEVSSCDAYMDLEAPMGVLTEELLEAVRKARPRLLKLLAWEHRKLEEAERRGLVIKWAKAPGWIALHDPTSGEWHKVSVSEYPP
jgi:hypothetical protein